jgi:hypothetical protein
LIGEAGSRCHSCETVEPQTRRSLLFDSEQPNRGRAPYLNTFLVNKGITNEALTE